jgi:hypothetical protein
MFTHRPLQGLRSLEKKPKVGTQEKGNHRQDVSEQESGYTCSRPKLEQALAHAAPAFLFHAVSYLERN